jgi:hypothetical protein
VGPMDRPMWWNEEIAATDRTECTLAASSH